SWCGSGAAKLLQDLLGMLSGQRRAGRPLRRCGAEARAGAGLHDAVVLEEHLASLVVRMPGRILHAQDRRKAAVDILQASFPMRARLRGKELFQHLALTRPEGCIVAVAIGLGVQAYGLRERRKELGFERAQRYPVSVGTAIGAIVGRAAVEQI